MAISKADAREEIAKLVDNFRKWKTEGKVQKWKEEETIQYLILPLFEALGWNVKDPDEADYQTHIQSKNSKRPDIIFKINGVPRLIVEAKAVKEDLNTQKYIIQATNYAYLKGLTWAVLTDFESIKVFSADREYSSKNPLQNYFLDIPWEQYLNRFEELWLLSNESFEKGLIDEAGERALKRVPRIRLDHAFAADLNKWRSKLENSIKRNNREKNLEKEELGEIVQKILDRLIFIRTCEDRGIRIGDKLNALVRQHRQSKRGSFTSLLNKTYLEYDRKFNSKLFTYDEKDEGSRHLCEKVKIDDKVLYEVIEGLYKEDDPTHAYNFDIIDADVLGAVYEQYLAYLQRGPKESREAKQKSKRKSQGIYYTPKYIVEYIVKNTLGEKLKKCKKPEDALKIRVLDPACGSGSFLIKAYDEFKDWYDKYLTKSNKVHEQTKLDLESEKSCRSFMDDVLRNCIYGVDLDPQAVEITQLNLLLKAAETRHRLPTLKNNIKCGNSLISDLEVAGDRAFDWNSEFKDIMEVGGFNVIIGNPPYIRIQNLNKKEVEYFNEEYSSPCKNYDIYILFIEKGFELLGKDGSLGLILPHKFFQAQMGEKIREYLCKNRALSKIINFGTNQIFEAASTYTCLLFLQKKANQQFRYKKFELGENYRNLHSINFEKKDIKSMVGRWDFISEGIQEVIAKIKSKKLNFERTTDRIFKGSSTGNDNLFLLEPLKENRSTYTVFSKEMGGEVELEKDLLKPFVYGEDIKRYSPITSKKLLLFPYKSEDSGIKLIPIDEMKSRYPLTYAYLQENKGALTKRKIETDNKNFYMYSAARSLPYYLRSKIMIPDMLISIRVGYDNRGILFHGPAIHSVVFNKELERYHPYFFLSILNSKVFWFFIVNTSTALRGDTYRLTPEFLNPFCFPEIDMNNAQEKDLHDQIVIRTKKMLSLNESLLAMGDKQTEKWKDISDKIDEVDSRIDGLVCKAYGITKSEMSIINERLSVGKNR